MADRYGLEIRAASGADAPGLAELLAEAGVVVPVRVLADRIEALRGQAGVVLLAHEWGPPSGVISAAWTRGLLHDAPVADVSLLRVGAGQRRRGVGRLLVKAASQAARQAGCAELVVRADDPEGDLAAFCLATGFARGGASFSRPLRKRS